MISNYEKQLNCSENNLSNIIDNYLDCYVDFESRELVTRTSNLLKSQSMSEDLLYLFQYISNIIINCNGL